jgi:hypothetical protein
MPTNKLILSDVDHSPIETGRVGSDSFRDEFERVAAR